MSDEAAPPTEPETRPAPLDVRELALRVFAVVGLTCSTILLVDYSRPEALFCAEHGGGCSAVRHSAFAHLGPISTPTLGTLYFTVILALVVLGARSPKARAALTALATLGGVSGAAFLTLQAVVIHAWCKFCVGVDTSALIVAALAWTLQRSAPAAQPPLRRLKLDYGTAAVAIAAFFVPVLYGLSQPPAPPRTLNDNRPTPTAILREQREGVATVVEFLDFECPYCRRNQEALGPVLASYRSQVRVVRRHIPLSFHTHARAAARAACCAEEQGHGDVMADALFRTDAERLTVEGCESVARETGLDIEAYRTCLASSRPDAAIEQANHVARDVGITGLPTFWIGTERFEGPQTPDVLRASIERALHPHPAQTPARADTSHGSTGT